MTSGDPTSDAPASDDRASDEADVGGHLSIGEVLDQLRGEFPDVTISKIRFLESQRLLDPERTPSGYRKFSDEDLERLRWILTQQRDNFLPLRVIRERLDQYGSSGTPTLPDSRERADAYAPVAELDLGGTSEDDEPLGALARDDSKPGDELTRAELLEAAELTDSQLSDLEAHGLVTAIVGEGQRALYGEDALAVGTIAAGFQGRGIQARHLKMYRHFAEREGALFAQVLLQYLRQRNPEARERLQEEVEELARLARRLRTEMLRQALRSELQG